MAAHNPYAPSKASLKSGGPGAASGGLWRDGDELVVLPDARFPGRCVKCDQPCEQPQKARTLYWHHPAVYLLLLGYVILYIIVASLVRKHVRVDPGLCSEHKKKRWMWIAIGWIGALFAWIPIAILGRKLEIDPGISMLVALAVFFAFAVLGIVKSRVLYAKRIDAQLARLKGAGEDFLASLPKYKPY